MRKPKVQLLPLAVIIALTAFSPLAASAKPMTYKLTLREALDLAGRQNRQLEAARQDVVRSDKAIQQANASYFPTLDLSGNSSRDNYPSHEGNTNLTGTLQLAYNLDTSGERAAQCGMAAEQLKNANLEVERLSQQLRLEVVNAYYDLENADQQLRIALLSLEQADALLSEAKVMKQGGEGSDFEIQRAELQETRARQGKADALSAQHVMRRTLARAIGLEPGSSVEAADAVEKNGDWPLSLDESIALALKGSPELAQLRSQKQQARHKGRLAFAGSLPKLQLFATAYERGLMLTPSWSVDNTTPGLGRSYQFGVQASLNLFNGGINRAASAQADAEAAIAGTRIEDTEQSIQLEVERAYSALQISKQDIALSGEALAKARQSLASARIRLKSGVGTQTDVIMVQGDLIQAEVSRNKSILDYNRAIATLERYGKNLALSPAGSAK